jgi:hypothetical protein
MQLQTETHPSSVDEILIISYFNLSFDKIGIEEAYP